MNPLDERGQPVPFLRQLQFLFFAILSSHLILAGVLVSVAQGGSPPLPLPNASWVYALLLLPAGLYAMSSLLGKRAVALAKAKPTLAEKLAAYRGGSIVRWAMMEGGFIAILVLYFLSHNVACLAAAALGLVGFFTQAPSATRLSNDLQLASDERQAVRGVS